MASGFIYIEEYVQFSIRWTGFDEVIKLIIRELIALDLDEDTKDLIIELESYIPPYELDDAMEWCWGFYDERIDDTTTRYIYLYTFKPEWIKLFWLAAINANTNLMERDIAYSALHPERFNDLVKLKR